MAQLWGGRFTKQTDEAVKAFNDSIGFDKRLYRQDIEGSLVHARMLGKQGILTAEESQLSRSALSLRAFFFLVSADDIISDISIDTDAFSLIVFRVSILRPPKSRAYAPPNNFQKIQSAHSISQAYSFILIISNKRC